MSKPQPDKARSPAGPEDMADLADYHDIARLVERMHRRFLDVVRTGLLRLGADDIGPVQALMVMVIGDDEMSVRELMERGYYLGSNASYSLKILVEAGYVERAPCPRDRRSARLRLSERGRVLRDELARMERIQAKALVRSPAEAEDLRAAYRTLRRLDRVWADLVRYSDRDVD